MTAVAVIGVSGSLGQQVARQLEKDPSIAAIVGVDRRSMPSGFSKLTFYRDDALDAQLAPLIDGVDVLVHVAWDVGPAGGVEGVPVENLGALGNVLRAAETAKVPQVIFISSATAYGAWPDNPIPISENAPLRPNPNFPYATQKADAEVALNQWADEHPEVTVTVLRPAVVVSGKRETPLARALSGVRAIRARDASHPVQYVHVEDLASAVVLVAKQRLAGAYNVAANGYLRDVMARELAGAPVPRGVPERLLPWINGAAWQFGLVEAAPAVLPYAEHPWVVANDKLRAAGWEPAFSNEEALVEWQPASLWGGISAHGKRKLITGGVIASSIGSVVAAISAIVRRRNRRSVED